MMEMLSEQQTLAVKSEPRGRPIALARMSPRFQALAAIALATTVASVATPARAEEGEVPPGEQGAEAEGSPGRTEPSAAEPELGLAKISVVEPEAKAEPKAESVESSASEPGSPSLFETLIPEIHGFVSQGFAKSTDNNFLLNTSRGSFEFTEVGLNFTKQLTDRMRAGMQLFMRDLGQQGNYRPQFDWFYLDYRFFDWLGIRAGRTKIPFGLYNETQDIDQGRVPILLPQSIYLLDNRDFLLAQTGGEIYGNVPLGPLGSLEYRGYGGTVYSDAATNPDVRNFDVPFIIGGRAMWETPLEGLRVGGSVQSLRMEWDSVIRDADLAALQMAGLIPQGADNRIHFDFPVTLWVASAEYVMRDLTLAAEYGQWHGSIATDEPLLIPPVAVTNERFYVMATYRAASWFSPGIYYAYLAPDMEDRSGVDGERHDVSVTTRYDINDHWLFKLEAHYFHGTADLKPELNGGTAAALLTRDWGLFLVKTTAYF